MPGVPAAVWAAAALTGAGMVDSNIQQKAAIKNNDFQNQMAVANAKQATNASIQRVMDFIKGNPDPTTGFTITGSKPIQAAGAGTKGANPAPAQQPALAQSQPQPQQNAAPMQQPALAGGGGVNPILASIMRAGQQQQARPNPAPQAQPQVAMAQPQPQGGNAPGAAQNPIMQAILKSLVLQQQGARVAG